MFAELGYAWELQVSPEVWEGVGTVASLTDSFQAGNHTLRVIVTGEMDNAVGNTLSEVIKDTTPPEIDLVGSSVIDIEVATTYVEPGYTAFDLCSGDLTSVVAVSWSVDVNTVGSHPLTYTVEDGAKLQNPGPSMWWLRLIAM